MFYYSNWHNGGGERGAIGTLHVCFVAKEQFRVIPILSPNFKKIYLFIFSVAEYELEYTYVVVNSPHFFSMIF